jgi:two-component system nitrate/nitrite response regulator NarL
MPINVVLADDHAIVLQGLRHLFESYDDFRVVACCQDADSALIEARSGACDVLVLDLRMPGLGGIDVLRALESDTKPCRTVLLTATISDDDVLEAIKLGAHGVVLKESSPEALIDCVRRVSRGESCLDEPLIAKARTQTVRREATLRAVTGVLTPREIDIVRMIAQGLRNKAIAERLSISEGTVKIHLHNVYEKLQLDGRLALMLYAQNKGLV